MNQRIHLAFACSIALSISSATAVAQEYPIGDQQALMQKMQEMQTCMAKIDQSELEGLQQRWMELNQELKSLCSGGKRSAAQKKALKLAQETARNPTIQAIAECSKGLRSLIPQQQMMKQPEDYANQHVCDAPTW